MWPANQTSVCQDTTWVYVHESASFSAAARAGNPFELRAAPQSVKFSPSDSGSSRSSQQSLGLNKIKIKNTGPAAPWLIERAELHSS